MDKVKINKKLIKTLVSPLSMSYFYREYLFGIVVTLHPKLSSIVPLLPRCNRYCPLKLPLHWDGFQWLRTWNQGYKAHINKSGVLEYSGYRLHWGLCWLSVSGECLSNMKCTMHDLDVMGSNFGCVVLLSKSKLNQRYKLHTNVSVTSEYSSHRLHRLLRTQPFCPRIQ